MKYQLVLQWPASAIEDYDSMVEIEDLLIEQLPSDSHVDGHDAGSGEVNIFIRTDSPERVFSDVQKILAARGLLTHARAAFREVAGDEYFVLWPKGLKGFEVA